MLNHASMTDPNPPVSLPMQSAGSGKGSVFGHNDAFPTAHDFKSVFPHL